MFTTNDVNLIGRFAADPEIIYTPQRRAHHHLPHRGPAHRRESPPGQRRSRPRRLLPGPALQPPAPQEGDEAYDPAAAAEAEAAAQQQADELATRRQAPQRKAA